MPPKAICTAQVIADGRVTLSAPVRRQLGIEEGDFVTVEVTPASEGGR